MFKGNVQALVAGTLLGYALMTPAALQAREPGIWPLGDSDHVVGLVHAKRLRHAPYVRSEHRFEIPDAILHDPFGKSFSLEQELAADGPVLLNFVSTRCLPECASMSATFSEVQRHLGSDMRRLRLISIAVEPRHDTPARLRAFAKEYQAGPAWMVLTGRSVEITPVLRAFGTDPADMGRHGSLAFLHANPKAPWVRIEGVVSPSELVTEYRQLHAR